MELCLLLWIRVFRNHLQKTSERNQTICHLYHSIIYKRNSCCLSHLQKKFLVFFWIQSKKMISLHQFLLLYLQQLIQNAPFIIAYLNGFSEQWIIIHTKMQHFTYTIPGQKLATSAPFKVTLQTKPMYAIMTIRKSIMHLQYSHIILNNKILQSPSNKRLWT